MKTDKIFLTEIDYEKYHEYSKEESSEFVHVWTHLKTWLNVDICLDDDGYYIMNNHLLWIYFKNGYSEDSEWIPLVVTRDICYIPLFDSHLDITESDYKEICDFGKLFYELIRQLADGTITYTHFASIVNESLNELRES